MRSVALPICLHLLIGVIYIHLVFLSDFCSDFSIDISPIKFFQISSNCCLFPTLRFLEIIDQKFISIDVLKSVITFVLFSSSQQINYLRFIAMEYRTYRLYYVLYFKKY